MQLVSQSRRHALVFAATLGAVLCAAPALATESDLFCAAGGGVFADEKIDVKKQSVIFGSAAHEFTHVATNGKAKIDDSTIHGDLHVGKKLDLKHDAVVTGEVVEGAPAVDLEDVSGLVAAHAQNHDNESIDPTEAGAVALEKGKLRVPEGDRLVLEEGDYYLEEVYLKKDAELVLRGDVRIFMAKGKFKAKRARVVPADEGGSLQVVIAEKGGVKLYASQFHGSIYAPSGKVYVKKGSVLSGALAVEKLKVYRSEIHAADACGGMESELPDWTPPTWTPEDEDEWGDDVMS